MFKIYVLRHGKSDWNASYGRDWERPLAPRGRRAAAAMGHFLAEHNVSPEILVTSSAVRARTTLERVAAEADWSAEPVVEDALYGASPREVIEIAERHRGGAGSILVCGHEPWCSGVVAMLCEVPAPRFPTATVACIEAPALLPGLGQLMWLQRPKELPDR